MKKDIKKVDEKIVDFLFETGMLAKTPRSGFFFLGSGEQSVAEHTNRVCFIGFALANISGKVNVSKVLEMCLFHDLAEARVSDLNYVHQKYNKKDEESAIKDLTSELPFGGKIDKILHEYEIRESYESKLAKDADNLEFILSLKEQIDIGNERAESWIESAVKRLKTKEAQDLVKTIIKTDSDRWWYGDKKDSWWIDRNKNN
ncbi:MAG: HD domain-containing protein [Candidatus Pacebacteria bacterium]|nr:HD domain-containing protein [Candidatus Paceibacterota bacterium]